MRPPAWLRGSTVASVIVALLVLLLPAASASGSGYNLTFSAAPSTADPAVDLVGLTTSASGTTVVITLTVAGQINLGSSSDAYVFFTGGNSQTSAAATAVFSDSTTGIWTSSYAGSGSYGYVTGTITNSGSSLQFSLNQSAVGPASSFTASAAAGGNAGNTASAIGSAYPGGTNCVNGTCVTNSVAAAIAWWVYAVIVSLVVIVVVVVLVVVLVMRSRRRQQPPMMAPGMGAPMPPPPGPGGAMPPPPPPSPPSP